MQIYAIALLLIGAIASSVQTATSDKYGVTVPKGYFAPDFREIATNLPIVDLADPPIRNQDQCWFKGYTLEDRPNNDLTYSPLHQLPAGYAYVISDEQSVIKSGSAYVHSLWAWVQQPSIEFSLLITQKIADIPKFIIRHMETIKPNRSGIHVVPVGRTIHDLGVPADCGKKDVLCTVRLGMLNLGSNTSAVSYSIGDSQTYNFEKELTHTEVDDGIQVKQQINGFVDQVRRQYSIAALVCAGNVSQGHGTEDPFDKTVPTNRPDVIIITRDVGESDNQLLLILGASLGGAALLLLIIVVTCAVYRCRDAGSGVPKANSKEADFIRNWNMGQFDGTFNRELMMPNEVYSSNKTVSRATGLQMASVMTAFEDGNLDPEKPVIYGNAAMLGRELSQIDSPAPLKDQEFVEEMQEVSEVPPQELDLKDELKGAVGKFASVWRADWKFAKSRQRVVVKQLKDKFSDRDIAVMDQKIDLLARLPPHPFVLGFIGPTTLENTPAMVLEYCDEGTLKSYLSRQRSRAAQRKISPELQNRMPRFCYEIASAMDFLHKRNVIHTRLCCRNVFLTRDLTCRVTGFGPQRDIDVADTEREVWRWLAPESHRDKVYTRESDMWMFGVTAWEIFSIGAMPLSHCATNEEVQQYVAAGSMPQQPPACPADIFYEVIIPSWRQLPLERPSFLDVCGHLSRFAHQGQQPSLHAHSYVSVKNVEGRQVLRPIPSAWLHGAFRKTMRSKKGNSVKALKAVQSMGLAELQSHNPPGLSGPLTSQHRAHRISVEEADSPPMTPLGDDNTLVTSGFDAPDEYIADSAPGGPSSLYPSNTLLSNASSAGNKSNKPLPPEPASAKSQVSFTMPNPTSPQTHGLRSFSDWQSEPGF